MRRILIVSVLHLIMVINAVPDLKTDARIVAFKRICEDYISIDGEVNTNLIIHLSCSEEELKTISAGKLKKSSCLITNNVDIISPTGYYIERNTGAKVYSYSVVRAFVKKGEMNVFIKMCYANRGSYSSIYIFKKRNNKWVFNRTEAVDYKKHPISIQ